MVADRVYSHVSVPFRGFRGLQGDEALVRLEALIEGVSVPLRGFRGLQAGLRSTRRACSSPCFSPLAGF